MEFSQPAPSCNEITIARILQIASGGTQKLNSINPLEALRLLGNSLELSKDKVIARLLAESNQEPQNKN